MRSSAARELAVRPAGTQRCQEANSQGEECEQSGTRSLWQLVTASRMMFGHPIFPLIVRRSEA